MVIQKDGREIWRVNAFTQCPFTGNPAGVVPKAEGLEDAEMQAIAAELNDVSETVFILPPKSPDADLGLRYFTSTTEVDLCGHATMAALFTLAWTGRITAADQARGVRVHTAVGVLQMGLEFSGGDLEWATMEQLEPELAPAPGAERAAEVLGLSSEQLAQDLEITLCSTGIWVCYVPLVDLSALAQVRIRPRLIRDLWPGREELCGVYAFAFRDADTTQGRFFSPPEFGIFEDPVTGTASGGLGACLMDAGRIESDAELIAHQGVEMGRPGRVRVWRNPNGRMAIGGQAVPIFRGRLLV